MRAVFRLAGNGRPSVSYRELEAAYRDDAETHEQHARRLALKLRALPREYDIFHGFDRTHFEDLVADETAKARSLRNVADRYAFRAGRAE